MWVGRPPQAPSAVLSSASSGASSSTVLAAVALREPARWPLAARRLPLPRTLMPPAQTLPARAWRPVNVRAEKRTNDRTVDTRNRINEASERGGGR